MVNKLRRSPGAAALVDRRPGQCLLMASEDLMPLDSPYIWIDNLYLRAAVPDQEPVARANISVGLLSVPRLDNTDAYPIGKAARFITRCTFQGDGLGSSVAFWGNEDAYLERTPRPGKHVWCIRVHHTRTVPCACMHRHCYGWNVSADAGLLCV